MINLFGLSPYLHRDLPSYNARAFSTTLHADHHLRFKKMIAILVSIIEQVSKLICPGPSRNELVKILGRGELKTKIDVTAHKFSATAKAAIKKEERILTSFIFKIIFSVVC